MTGSDLDSTEPELFRSRWIHRWGRTGGSVVGVTLAAVFGYAAVAAISGLVIPLLIATVIGVLGVPAVDVLERRRIPRSAGAAIFLLFLAGVLGERSGSRSSASATKQMRWARRLATGIDTIGSWVEDRDIDLSSGTSIVDAASSQAWDLLPGAAGYLGSIFSSVVAFLAGTLLAVFFLYYILVDWNTLRTWLCGHLNLPPDLGRQIIDDPTSIVRQPLRDRGRCVPCDSPPVATCYCVVTCENQEWLTPTSLS